MASKTNHINAEEPTLISTSTVDWEAMSFEELYSRSRPFLKSVVEARLNEKLLQRVDASDVVQESLLEVFKRLDDFRRRKPMPIQSWLRETAIQQLRIAIRRHQTAESRSVTRQVSYERSSVFRLAEQLTAIVQTAEKRMEETEQAIRTREALLRLPTLDREILLLRYVNGLNNHDAAQVLGVTDTVASKRHCRALVRLQQQLEDK